MEIVCLCLGGMAGTLLRYFICGCMSRVVAGFPVGTLTVNVFGCLIIGFTGGVVLGRGRALPAHWQAFLVTGFLGAFTTFSTFGYDSWKLLQAKEVLKMVLYVSANLVLGFSAVWGGAQLGKTLGS